MMRDRLLQLKKLLAPDGSIWVHCDDYEQHRLRCLLDEALGSSAFVATIVWQKRTSRDNRTAFSSMHDYVHVYAARGAAWSEVRNRLEDMGGYSNPDNDPRGPWRSVPMSAQAGHATAAQFYDIVSPTGVVHPPPKGRCWTYTRPRFEELVGQGRVYWPKAGDGRPRLKRYPEEATGLVPFTIWPADEVDDNDDAKKQILAMFPEHEAFATPKPERLMERIAHIASNPGDVVLDCFAGSGTTAAVAHKLGRRWVAVEWSRETIETFTGPRLEKVVRGEDAGGITESAGWEGGGGFRVLDVAPSMFDEDGGQVVLADWALGTALAEATAAQLGFAYDPDALPFCGRKGRTRLAVVDGLVNEGVVRLLAAELEDDERLTVCGTMVDPAARDVLSELRPGSSLRKVPESILADYRVGHLWWDGHARQESRPALESPADDGAVTISMDAPN